MLADSFEFERFELGLGWLMETGVGLLVNAIFGGVAELGKQTLHEKNYGNRRNNY